MKKAHGAIYISFIAVLPVLLLILFAIIEFGWYGARVIVLDNIVRQATRIGCRGVREAELRAYIHSRFVVDDSEITIYVLDVNHNDIGDPDDRTFGNYLVVEIIIEDVGIVLPIKLDLHSRHEFLIESG